MDFKKFIFCFLALITFHTNALSQNPIYYYDCPDENVINLDSYNEFELSIIDKFYDTYLGNNVVNAKNDAERLQLLLIERQNMFQIYKEYESYVKSNFNDIGNHRYFELQNMFESIFEYFEPLYTYQDFSLSSLDREIIDIAIQFFDKFSEEKGLYFDGNKNMKKLVAEYQILYSKRIFEYYDNLNDDRANIQSYEWLKKRLNIYKKIYESKDKQFLVRQIGQIEPQCSIMSQQVIKKWGKLTKMEIEEFYPHGSFELDFFKFMYKMFYREPYFTLESTEDLIYLYLYLIDDIEEISEDFTIYNLESAKYFSSSDEVTNNEELITSLKVSLLTGLKNIRGMILLTQTSRSSLNTDLIDKMVLDILRTIDQDLLFKSQQYSLSIEYIASVYELRRTSTNTDEDGPASGSLYDKAKFNTRERDYLNIEKFSSVLKKIRRYHQQGSIKLSSYDLEVIDTYLQKFNSIDNLDQRLVTLFESLPDNPTERQLRKAAKKMFKDINLKKLGRRDFFFLIGFVSSIDRETAEFFIQSAFNVDYDDFLKQFTYSYIDWSDSLFKEAKDFGYEDMMTLMSVNDMLLTNALISSNNSNNKQLIGKYLIDNASEIFTINTLKDIQDNPELFNYLKSYIFLIHYYKWKIINDSKYATIYINGSQELPDLDKIIILDKLLRIPNEKDNDILLIDYFFDGNIKKYINKTTLNENEKLFYKSITKALDANQLLILFSTYENVQYLIEDYDHFLEVILISKDKDNKLLIDIVNSDQWWHSDFRDKALDYINLSKKYFKNSTIEPQNLSALYNFVVTTNNDFEEKLLNAKSLLIITEPTITSNLPFEAFYNNESQSLLLYNYDKIDYLNSINDLLYSQTNNVKNNVLAIGSIDYKDLPKLTFSSNELELLKKFKNVKFLNGVNASESNIKKYLENNSPKIIHFAVHGIPGNNSRNASLALDSDSVNDGLLTADEIKEFNLDGTNLVVLSACDTNSGKEIAELGIFSLQSAFKSTGVKNIISTLWPIDDKATYLFMAEFYAFYNGLNSSEALMLSKKSFIAKYPEYSNPHYWAAFVHYGTN